MDDVRTETADSSASTPGYGFVVARFLVWCGLGAAVVVLFAGLWLPWQADLSAWTLLGSADASDLSGRAWWVIVLVPVTVAACVVALVWSRRVARLPLVLVTFVGTVFVLGSVPGATDDRWIGWGTGAALIGYPLALVLSVALFALSGRTRLVVGARPRPVITAVGLVPIVVAAGLVGAGGVWYAQRQVHATTAGTAVPAVTGSPGRLLWQARETGLGVGPVALASGLVVTAEEVSGQVTVTDAATGKPRWHYSRDASVASITASRDERTVVAVFETRARDTVLGFDASTGAVRWQWWAPQDASQVTALSDVIMAVQPDDHGTATALDPSTGRQLWSLHGLWPAADDGTCAVPDVATGDAGVAADAELTAVLVVCNPQGLVVRAVDRSGHQRWTAHYPRGFDGTAPAELLAVSGAAVLVWNVDPDRIIAFGPATGRVDWTVDSDEEDWVGDDGNTVLLAKHRVPNQGTLRQIDATTGKPTATQPPTNVTLPPDLGIPPDVTDTPDGGTVHLAAAVRAGRAYVLSSHPTGRLTVLDLRSDRVLASYPVPDPDAVDPVPAPGYAVLTDVHRELALRLPTG